MHGFDNNNMVFTIEYYKDYGKTRKRVKSRRHMDSLPAPFVDEHI